MRKIILTGVAVIVVIAVGGGIAVTRAGAQPDPSALLVALNEFQPQADSQTAPPGTADDDGMMLAQAALPPAPGAEAPPPPPGMPGRMGPDGMQGRMGPPGWIRERMQHAMMRHNLFALFYRSEDKHLTAPDVQKIAEAFLLWQGNRDWKVTQVAAGANGKIDFDFATADGGVIARFAMDSKTGRIERLG